MQKGEKLSYLSFILLMTLLMLFAHSKETAYFFPRCQMPGVCT